MGLRTEDVLKKRDILHTNETLKNSNFNKKCLYAFLKSYN